MIAENSLPALTHPWKHAAVVLNRESGTLSQLGPDAVADELRELLEQHGLTVDLACVPGADMAAALKRAVEGPADLVFIGGGDGTVASAATLLAGTIKPLAVLPLGTFNLAARDFGVPLLWQEAVISLLKAPVAEVDALEIEGQLYLCVAVLGFYPALALGRPEYHGSWLVKAWRTAVDTFRSALESPRLELELVDEHGQVTRHRTRMALMVNNDYEDLFGLVPRRQSLDSGWLTAYISTHRTRWGMARAVLAWVFGKWKQERELTMLRARRLRLRARRERRLPVMMDGEIKKLRLPFEIILRPKALRVLVPRALETEVGEET